MKMIKLFFILAFICGVIYPMVITVVAVGIFPEKAGGSLLRNGDKIVGSSLLAQKFVQDDFFHPRPSAADYGTVSSGASHASPTQKVGIKLREERRALMPTAGVDAWTTSGSGLDPHISPETALAQIPRVAKARSLQEEAIIKLVKKYTEGRVLGIWGQPRVNVLELNMALIEGNYGNSGSTLRNP